MLSILACIGFCGCHEQPSYANDPYGNFDALWDVIDTRYCFFPENGVDWDAVGNEYRARLFPGISEREFFDVCSGMLAELRDGHVNLIAPFDTYSYREWWTAYPQNFNLRCLQEYYLHFDWKTIGGIQYAILPPNIGYIRYPSFSYDVSQNSLDWIFAYLADCSGLIIDIRDNGGGELENITTFLGRFIHQKAVYAYICHKTGPAHDALSKPYGIEYSPAGEGHIPWNKPVAVLINRSCFSAANTFAAVMKELPGVTLIGSRTGGGGGMPYNALMPNGWNVRFSALPVLDVRGESIENGVNPTEGFEVVSTDADLAAGHDHVLDAALRLLTPQYPQALTALSLCLPSAPRRCHPSSE